MNPKKEPQAATTKELIDHILRCAAIAKIIEEKAGTACAEEYIRTVQFRWKMERPFMLHTFN